MSNASAWLADLYLNFSSPKDYLNLDYQQEEVQYPLWWTFSIASMEKKKSSFENGRFEKWKHFGRKKYSESQ